MFARLVTINGKEIWVYCIPQTPLAEVLRRAAVQLERESSLASPQSKGEA